MPGLLALLGLAALGGCGEATGPMTPAAEGTAPRSLAVPVPRAFTQMDIGSGFACALRDDGVIECWGPVNEFGQAPAIRAASNGGTFTQVRAGVEFACALRADGVVECWGNNEFEKAPPTVAASVGHFTQLTIGANHGCGLRNDGVAECWGLDGVGQAPAERAATSGAFTKLAGGAGHTCGLRTDGLVECWGRDDFGEAPALRAPLTGGTYTDLTAGSFSTCAIRPDGVVECWGRNDYLQTLPERAPSTGKFVQVATDRATCGVRDDGGVECWGDGVLMYPPPSSGVFTQVESNHPDQCGLRVDGTVLCWTAFLADKSPSPSTVRVNPTAAFIAPTSAVVGVPFQLALDDAEVPGYPAATSFTYAFDCGDGTGYGTASATSSASCPTSATGTRTVKGTVIDQDGDAAEYTAQVAIVTVSEGTSDLLAGVSTAALSPDLRKALAAKLRSALDAIAKGRTNAACSALQDFINQVNAQRGKAIPTATADAWLAQATQLRTALGC